MKNIYSSYSTDRITSPSDSIFFQQFKTQDDQDQSESSFYSNRKQINKNNTLKKTLKGLLKNNAKETVIHNPQSSFKNFLNCDYKQNINDYCTQIEKLSSSKLNEEDAKRDENKEFYKKCENRLREKEKDLKNWRTDDRKENKAACSSFINYTLAHQTFSNKTISNTSLCEKKGDTNKKTELSKLMSFNQESQKLEASFSVDKSLLPKEIISNIPEIKITGRFSNDLNDDIESRMKILISENQRLERENKLFRGMEEKCVKEKKMYEKAVANLKENLKNAENNEENLLFKHFSEKVVTPFLHNVLGYSLKGNFEKELEVLTEILNRFEKSIIEVESKESILSKIKEKLKVNENDMILMELEKLLADKKKFDSMVSFIKSAIL